MKKVIIISAIILAVILSVSILAMFLLSPDETHLDGTYSAVSMGTGRILEFDGNKVTATHMAQNIISYKVTGTYEITDEYIIMDFSSEDVETNVFAGKKTFEKGDGYIVVDGYKYTKSE